MNIGFFDSGLGGLTILKAVARELPEYNYHYYGDTEHLPYGDKTEKEVYSLTKAGVLELFKRDCVLVIVACNSASAETLRKLQHELLEGDYQNHRILGMIIPTVEELITTDTKSALLLATKRTVDSNKYQKELDKLETDIQLTQIAAVNLVPLIEIGDTDMATEEAIRVIDGEGGKSEVLVLGCTHYTVIKEQLRAHYKNKKIISQDELIPPKLQNYLHNHPELETKLTKEGKRQVHLTEHKPYYDQILQQLLGGVLVEEDN